MDLYRLLYDTSLLCDNDMLAIPVTTIVKLFILIYLQPSWKFDSIYLNFIK